MREVSVLDPHRDAQFDYIDLVNTVERHTKCNSAYCSKTDSNGNQSCRFKFPMETAPNTHLKYQKINKQNESFNKFRPAVIGKRNDPRLNRHQQFQLQTWRANSDIQLVIDYYACIEYLAKYASKAEKNVIDSEGFICYCRIQIER